MGSLAQDSGSSIRYMNSGRQPEGCHYPKKKDNLKNLKESEETEDWIPQETFKLAFDFKNKYAN